MRFARAFGSKGDAPGQFGRPLGIAVLRGLLVVSEYRNKRVQVLTLKGVPLQVIKFADHPKGICADAQRVWVTEGYDKVRVLKIKVPA